MTDNRWADVHAQLSALFDESGYAGYRPTVRESANGDGVVDTGKRYLHVAIKYAPPDWALDYLARAHWESCRIAERIGVPDAYYPRVEDGTLRVLEYPSAGHVWTNSLDGHCSACGFPWTRDRSNVGADPFCPVLAAGAGTAEHTDMDLFTANLWRSTPEDHEQQYQTTWTSGAPAWHLGEIGELVGLGRAVPHRVPARPYAQRALVYFAMPALSAKLPCWIGDVTVGDWLRERKARSRY